ncbi:prolyl oligopeptidase family serine peptidase [Emcibacteraceae bacterium]|nr:prolyl oligopeptidase family serine peptidase [Emcibacteraceae bacterium]
METRLFISIILIIWFAGANAFADQKGQFEIVSNSQEIFGDELSSLYNEIIAKDENIALEIQVPENYNSENPPGIMVYISPQNQINIPRGWLELMDTENLIWVAARESGNKTFITKRILLTLAGLQYVQENFSINSNRVYISGLFGGGRIASMVATQYPQFFKGAIYNCGVNFWNDINEEQLNLIKNNRFVFLTGTDDFNLNDTKKVYAKYKKANVKNIDLMIIPRMGHTNPKKNRFAKAINFLDQK